MHIKRRLSRAVWKYQDRHGQLYQNLSGRPLHAPPMILTQCQHPSLLLPNKHCGIRKVDQGSRMCSLTRSAIRLFLPFVFTVRLARKCCLHGSEPPVARTGQYPWIRPGLAVLTIRNGYCSNSLNYVELVDLSQNRGLPTRL